MKILAIDPGVTQAGFALYSPDHPEREAGIECLSFSATAAKPEAKCEQFSRHLQWIICHYGPDFLCFEQAIRQIFTYDRKPDLAGARAAGPSADQLILAELQGAIRQAAICHVLPFDSVPVKTWRANIYGAGGGNLDRDAAKQRARWMCESLKIKAKNHNECEASMIALWGATVSQVYRAKLYGLAL